MSKCLLKILQFYVYISCFSLNSEFKQVNDGCTLMNLSMQLFVLDKQYKTRYLIPYGYVGGILWICWWYVIFVHAGCSFCVFLVSAADHILHSICLAERNFSTNNSYSLQRSGDMPERLHNLRFLLKSISVCLYRWKIVPIKLIVIYKILSARQAM